jgi:hypothetical protein
LALAVGYGAARGFCKWLCLLDHASIPKSTINLVPVGVCSRVFGVALPKTNHLAVVSAIDMAGFAGNGLDGATSSSLLGGANSDSHSTMIFAVKSEIRFCCRLSALALAFYVRH